MNIPTASQVSAAAAARRAIIEALSDGSERSSVVMAHMIGTSRKNASTTLRSAMHHFATTPGSGYRLRSRKVGAMFMWRLVEKENAPRVAPPTQDSNEAPG